MTAFDQLARLGVATVHEALEGNGVVDVDLIQVVPGSRCAGPARTVRTGQNDNLMVHAALDRLRPGEVLVLTMPEPAPVALVGELIALQAFYRRAAGILIDAAVRDMEQLRDLALPIWARWVRATGTTKDIVGTIDEAVTVGGVVVKPGDAVVLDEDGAVIVPRHRIDQVVALAQERERREAQRRDQYRRGALAYDLSGLRQRVEGARPPLPKDG